MIDLCLYMCGVCMTTALGMSAFRVLFLPSVNASIIMLIVSVFLQMSGSLIYPQWYKWDRQNTRNTSQFIVYALHCHAASLISVLIFP